jgi:predicted nucleic acid-binding protein
VSVLVDTYLAAVAVAHDPTIVTRNVRDFASLGVGVLNPYGAP